MLSTPIKATGTGVPGSRVTFTFKEYEKIGREKDDDDDRRTAIIPSMCRLAAETDSFGDLLRSSLHQTVKYQPSSTLLKHLAWAPSDGVGFE